MRGWTRARTGVAVAALCAVLAGEAAAQCVGRNLVDALPPGPRAELDRATAAQPYARGNLWTARRGDRTMTVVGTDHLSDPRHAATVAAVGPLVDGARALLVEAGPEEEAAIRRAFGENPGLLTLTEGPSLLELLPEPEWARLSAAMAARGIPPFMAAKFRPWYVSVMLSVPPCAMGAMTDPKGLDRLLIDRAAAGGVPIRALEPYDTLFAIFDAVTMEEQLAMIRSALRQEDRVADMSVTLTDLYVRGESRATWEFMRLQSGGLPGLTPERVGADFARMEDLLMIRRNRAWIPVIEAASAESPIVVAFGALHLSGEAGVLNLLGEAGWTLEPLGPE